MTKLRNTGIAFLLALGFVGVTAVPAQAVTVYHNYSYWVNGYYTDVKYCWHDYNWWEETFQFKRDGYKPCGLRFN